MKIFVSIFILSFIYFTSCKKNYTCECSFKNIKTVHTIENQTKKNATIICNDYNTPWQDANGSCIISK